MGSDVPPLCLPTAFVLVTTQYWLQRERQRQRQRQRETEKDRETERDRERDRQRERDMHAQTHMHMINWENMRPPYFRKAFWKGNETALNMEFI